MPIIVTKIDGQPTDAESQQYLRSLCRTLLPQHVNLVSVPRVQEVDRWFYAWPTIEDAQEFARLLNEQFDSVDWEAREIDAEVSHGPISPLELQVGRRRDGIAFAVAPWVRHTLKQVHPGSCEYTRVFIAFERLRDESSNGQVEHLSERMLKLLTGLSTSELAEFEAYVVIDPVTGEVVVAPTMIQSNGAVARQ